MRAAVRVHPAWSWLALAVIVGSALAIVSQVVAERAPGQASAGPALAAQASPTLPFGPMITAPPQPTITPGGPSLTPAPVSVTPSPAATATISPTPGVSPTPLPTYTADLMGIQVSPGAPLDVFDIHLSLIQRTGVKWIKLQFAWDLMEPQPGQFSEVYLAYRLLVQRANQQGFRVMISIVNAPDWARATAEEEGPPQDPQALAAFITQLMSDVRVDLYGNSYFNAIEVWNEPNLRREWNGATISGASYMQLFDAAYQAIRAGEGGHSVTVLTAGLAPTGINDGVSAVDDREFLRQMYQAGLANAAYQNIGIGVHPYGAANPPDALCCGTSTAGYDTHPSWFFLNTIQDYRATMEQNGDSARQLWATEFGWGTYEGFTTSDGNPAVPPADPPYLGWLTQEQQANYVMRAFEIAQSLPYMGPMILWNFDYSSQDYIDQSDPRAAYAMLRGGADPLRPTFHLLEAAPKR